MTELNFPSSPTNGQTYAGYVYDSTKGVWNTAAVQANQLSDLSDVNSDTPTTDDSLVYDGTEWVPGLAPSSVASLKDVNLGGGLSDKNVLIYNDGLSLWQSRGLAVSDISDINLSGVSNGKVLAYSTSSNTFVAQDPATLPTLVSGYETIADAEEKFQFALRNIDFGLVQPVGNSTTLTQIGTAVSAAGTASAVNVGTATIYERQRRIRYTSGGTNGNNAGVRHQYLQFFRERGFLFTAELGYGTSNASKRDLIGFRSTAAEVPNIAYNTTGNTYHNSFFIGSDTTDANLCVYHSAAATPTRIDLGPNFPSTLANVWYRIRIQGSANGFFYRVRNRSTGEVTEGTITTNIPSTTTLLTWNAQSSRAGANAVVDLGFVYFQMDFDLE
jgi:hypothetical protein